MRPTPRAVSALALAMGSLAGLTHAQQPVFRTGVDHVSLDVVVTDTQDHPVVGLTPADFTVREADRVQTLDDFRYVSIPAQRAPVDLAAPRLPERDVATNPRTSDTSRAIVIVIDENMIPARMIVQSKRVLSRLLQGLAPNDEAAVIYVGHSNLSQDFTNDVGRLADAVNRMRVASGTRGWPMAQRDVLWLLENAQKVLESAVQPRKFVVYVSLWAPTLKPDLKLSPTVWADDFEKLRRSDIPIYPLSPIAKELVQIPQGFYLMSDFTGGHTVFHPGDPAETAADLMAENGSYYLLGYYPTPFVRDDQFHPVTVSVNRPNVHVRARQGYWARPLAAVDPQQSLNAALGAGLDNPSLPVELFAAPVAPSAKGMRTVVTARISYPDGTPAAFEDQLRVGLVAVDPDASIKAQHDFVVSVHQAAAVPGPSTVVVDDVLDLPAQALTLRLAIASTTAHATGTAHLELTVPQTQRDGPTLGGLAIATTTTAPAAYGWDAIQSLVPFQPTTARMFATTDTLRVFARAYWKPSGQPDAGAEAVIRILDGPTSQTETLTGSPIGSTTVGATVDATLPLTGLTPGTHVLQVEVRRAGRPAADGHVVFDIR